MKPIYLDYNATTPLDPRVFDAMKPYLQEHFGNAASANSWGWTAEEALKKSRQQVAELLGAKSTEIFFTAGATESNNWVIRGLIEALKIENPQIPLHILTTKLEHSSVLESFTRATQIYSQVSMDFVNVDRKGQVDLEDLQKKITPQTKLISIMAANNEIGTIYPIQKIGEICRQHQIYFHCDATQGVGKMDFDLKTLPVDYLTFSAHKIYGPKGVGILYRRTTAPLAPMIWGGGQEHGMRGGTANVAGIVGAGKACELIQNEYRDDLKKIVHHRNLLCEKLHTEMQKKSIRLQINGDTSAMVPSTLNISFLDAQIPMSLTAVACSRSSACHSHAMTPSRILTTIGVEETAAKNTLRLSFGRFTTEDDIQQAVQVLSQMIQHKSEKIKLF